MRCPYCADNAARAIQRDLDDLKRAAQALLRLEDAIVAQGLQQYAKGSPMARAWDDLRRTIRRV